MAGLSFIIAFDSPSSNYHARLPGATNPTGKGNSLYEAIDDLESKLGYEEKMLTDSTVEKIALGANGHDLLEIPAPAPKIPRN